MLNYLLRLKEISAIFLVYFLVLTINRIVEALLLNYYHFIEGLSKLFVIGIINDIKSTFIFWLILGIITVKKPIKNTLIIILSVFVVFGLVSSIYFTITLQQLDQVLFQFSIVELKEIILSFGNFEWYYLLILIPFPSIYFLNLWLKKHKKITFLFMSLLSLIGLFFFFFPSFSTKSSLHKKITSNNTYYFLNEAGYYLFNKHIKNSNIQSENKTYASYPLLKSPSKRNPLSSLINLKENPPNFVFIIVESLSSVYSGPQAKEISFTPYLDSLANHSIYFPNFIATTERTFGVLPSTLASLPHGQKGFSFNQLNMPFHNSLSKILAANGYQNTFYYGGDSKYDHMKTFLELNDVSKIVDHKEFNYEGTGKTLSIDDVPFGVNDKILFEEAVKDWSSELKAPFFHIYLTLSMHHPFKFENQEKYIDKVHSIIQNNKNERLNKEKYLKQVKMFSTSIYTDESIKFLIESYQKSPEFNNTIFFIFGDHMFGPIAKNNPLEKFLVPLYIYSPLIHTSKTVKSVNSHLDISPSVLALVRGKYNFEVPEQVHWLGKPFDLEWNESNDKKVLLMLNNRDVINHQSGNYFTHRDLLYRIDENFTLTELEEPILKDKLLKERDSIYKMHQVIIRENKIELLKDTLIQLQAKQLDGMVFKQTEEYVNLLDRTFLSNHFELSLNFDFIVKQTYGELDLDSLPAIVIRIKDQNDNLVYWKSFDFKNYGQINNENFQIKNNLFFKSSSMLSLKEKSNIKIYFWNYKKSNATFLIEKGNVELKAIKK